MKIFSRFSKIEKYVSIGIFVIILWSINGCKEDDGPVEPQPSGEIILERISDGKELNRWDMDKAFLETYYNDELSMNTVFHLDLFSENVEVTLGDNDITDLEGEGLQIDFEIRNVWPKPFLEPNNTTCQNTSCCNYPEDYAERHTAQRGTLDPKTGIPLGNLLADDVEMRTSFDYGLDYGWWDYEEDGIHFQENYCLYKDSQLTITPSTKNANWYRVELVYKISNFPEDNLISGYYEGPISAFRDVENPFPVSGQVRTICGRFEGDADGIPGALSSGNLDFYLSRFTPSIFISDYGNNVVRSYDEENGVSTLSQSFVAPASIVTLPNEIFDDLYVAETRDKQLRRVNSQSGFTEGVLIQQAEGGTLEGNATWYKSLAVNQDPTLFQRTIYALNASTDQEFGNRIVRLEISAGGKRAVQSIVAGNGISVADEVLNGPSNIATFNFPEDIAVDYQDNIYVADGHSIRRIDAQTRNVTTLAGLDENGNYLGMPADYEVNNVFDPNGDRIFTGFISVAYDAFNDRIIATHINNEIWAFSEDGGQLESELIKRAELGADDGTLEEATFNRPNNVQVDPENGDIYLADGARIRRIRIE